MEKVGKIILVLFALLPLFSCDPPGYSHFYLENQRTEPLLVKLKTYDSYRFSFTKPTEKILFYSESGLGYGPTPELVFQNIEIFSTDEDANQDQLLFSTQVHDADWALTTEKESEGLYSTHHDRYTYTIGESLF